MKIPAPNTITFRNPDGSEVSIPEPTVAQIERLLAIESKEVDTDKHAAAVDKLVALCIRPAPPVWQCVEWIAWRREVAGRKRWIREMTYPALSIVLNTLLVAANGIDVSSIEELIAATPEKKTARRPMKSPGSTGGGSTTSPNGSVPSPKKSEQ